MRALGTTESERRTGSVCKGCGGVKADGLWGSCQAQQCGGSKQGGHQAGQLDRAGDTVHKGLHASWDLVLWVVHGALWDMRAV